MAARSPRFLAMVVGVLAVGMLAKEAWAQPQTAPTGTGSGPTIADSGVGYIDYAIPASVVRLRVDSAYDNNRPNRAEFFYARGAPSGPGLPLPETQVDYQDILTCVEHQWVPRASTFVEMPVRFLNPEVNANAAGYADMNAGFKLALLSTDDSVFTFQLRTYIPTGDADRGLGTRHVSLEPAALMFQKLTETLRAEGEFRYWVPAGGTDFAGDVLRYGIGLNYGRRSPDSLWFAPVAELVGWWVLSGQETVVQVPGGIPVVQSASGDSILNFKLGLRTGFGERGDLYAGYGRPLTGEVWYENIWRMEFRLRY